MTHRRFRSILLASIVGGGVSLFPAPLPAFDYLLLVNYTSEPLLAVIRMDAEGNVAREKLLPNSGYTHNMAASPNGQVALTTGLTSPCLSAFWIGRDGGVAQPRSYNPVPWSNFPPVGFHLRLPLVYVGGEPFTASFRVNYREEEIIPTSHTVHLDSDWPFTLGYSRWSDHLVYQRSGSLWGMQSIGLRDDGGFTTTTALVELPINQMNNGFAISPDGLWAVAIGVSKPQMTVLAIDRSGELHIHQQFSYGIDRLYDTQRVRFTSDGKYLILLNDYPHDLISYTLNPSTGLWEEVSSIAFYGGGFTFAITPDDRYLVLVGNYPGPMPDGQYYRTLVVLRLEPDGSFTRLPEKDLVLPGLLGALEFVPPWRETYPGPQGMVIH